MNKKDTYKEIFEKGKMSMVEEVLKIVDEWWYNQNKRASEDDMPTTDIELEELKQKLNKLKEQK